MSIFRILLLSFIALGLSQMLSGQDFPLAESARVIVLLDHSNRAFLDSQRHRAENLDAIILLARSLRDQQKLSVVTFSGDFFDWTKNQGEEKLKEFLQSFQMRAPLSYTDAMMNLAKTAKENSSWKNDLDKLVIVLGPIKDFETAPAMESSLMKAYQTFEGSHSGRPVSYVVIDRSQSPSLNPNTDILTASKLDGKIDFNNVAFVRADDKESLMRRIEEMGGIFFESNSDRPEIGSDPSSTIASDSVEIRPSRDLHRLEANEIPAANLIFPNLLFTNKRSQIFQQIQGAGFPIQAQEGIFPFDVKIESEKGGHRLTFTRKAKIIDEALLKKTDDCYQVDRFNNADLATKTKCADLVELSAQLEKERAFHDAIDLKSLLMSLSKPGVPIVIESGSPHWLFGGDHSHEVWVPASQEQVFDLIETYSAQHNLFWRVKKVKDLASREPGEMRVADEISVGGKLEKPSAEVLGLLREVSDFREPSQSEIEYEKSYFFDGIYISFAEHLFDFEILNEIEARFQMSNGFQSEASKDQWLGQWTKHKRYQIRSLLEEERWTELKTRYTDVFQKAGIPVAEIKKEFRKGRAGVWVSFKDPFKPFEVFEALARFHMDRGESNESLIEIFGDYYGTSSRDLQRQINSSQKDSKMIEIRKTQVHNMEEIIRKLTNPKCDVRF